MGHPKSGKNEVVYHHKNLQCIENEKNTRIKYIKNEMITINSKANVYRINKKREYYSKIKMYFSIKNIENKK